MSIEQQLDRLSNAIELLNGLLQQQAPLPVVPRKRGRPPKVEVTFTGAPNRCAPVETAEDAEPVTRSGTRVEKHEVRTVLEAYRERLIAKKRREGVSEEDAKNFATSRVLARLLNIGGSQSLANLPESKYQLVLDTLSREAV
jgi:hypothetical protein